MDLFLPNQREAFAIARCDDVETVLHALANGVTRTVIKCGGEGVVTRDDADNVLRVHTQPPIQLRDSTGAGDSFDAGFLHAWLAGMPLRDCLRWGNACGGLSMRGIGGTECQADAVEVNAWLEAQA